MGTEFATCFEALTGYQPLRWQVRLHDEWFAKGELPPIIDLPTGMGKTMVMAIWLIARAENADKIPTRLIYVVDRRTVVDQATDIAEDLAFLLGPENPRESEAVANRKPKLAERKQQFNEILLDLRVRLRLADDRLGVSTLRGQLADNREWSRDPSKPAIVIGTVDLVGSALLFSGYRSSFKQRPLEAGLLGQDSLLVLDEAHLSRPFETLVCDIDNFQSSHGSPMRVIRMSATGRQSNGECFTLQFDATGNLTAADARDAIISERFGANKRLTVKAIGEKDDLKKSLAEAAMQLAQNPNLIGKRIVVFVRKPEDALNVADAIRKHGSTKAKPGPFVESVEVLTGTMRGLERDELVKKAVFTERWLNGALDPSDPANQQPVFLVSTSAGEVGFDLNGDHMVCDATTIDSLIQRLGRVNRRGLSDAMIHLLVERPKNDKDGKPKKLDGFELAVANTVKLLQAAGAAEEEPLDVSPKNIAVLKAGTWKDSYAAACSPEVPTVKLTDILLDAWSMTSITDRMAGRPEVGPWLRGIAEELPQTTIAWRTELELVNSHPDPAKTLQRIFAKHPIRPHESITTKSGYVVEFLERACKLKDRAGDPPNTRIALRLSQGKIVFRTPKDLVEDPGILNAEPTLILPATLGGLNAAGMLDAEAIPRLSTTHPPPRSLDVADHPGYEQREDASPRLRVLIRRTDDGVWVAESLPGCVVIAERLQVQPTYVTSTELLGDLRKTGLRVRLVQPIELDDEGDAVRSLVLLCPVSNKNKPEDQSLDDHVGAVEAEARRIASALQLPDDAPVRMALLFAARWHDEGKKADIWQRFVYGPGANGQYKGKSSKSRDPKSLLGYRHEFGSLLRIHHSDRCGTTGCVVPANPDARELALHLIATHHGMGRPHFPAAVYREFSDDERDAMHVGAIRRFARLQRNYGWWRLAWLENLLRCADARASAHAESEDDTAEVEQ